MRFLGTPLVADLVAFFIALIAIFIFEWVKRPCIEVELKESGVYADIPEGLNKRKRARIAHLTAFNRPIYRNWIQRNTATNCRSKITVKDAAGNILHNEVETKWAAREEPFRTIALTPADVPVLEIKDYLVGQCNRLDIYANDDGEPFAIALKVNDDPNCYLFKGESYRSTNQWRLPEYQIPLGNFTIDVYVKGDNGKSSTKRYRLLNSGTTPQGLTLESV
jgi:hypothetical protein